MKGFWEGLVAPFFIQAPMEDVTDAAFRQLIATFGKPDVVFTEFTSADGLILAPESGKQAILKKLLYSENERPIVAQLFTSYPDRMEAAAKVVRDLGFDGLDINMGCPDRSVEKSGCGAALMKNPDNARALIRAAKRGSGLPVSVKTRIGYAQDELDTWLPALLSEEPVAVTIHARTRNELSDVPARWDMVAKAVRIRDALKSDARIVGNGDVKSVQEARARAQESGADGVMLGRAIYGNPWLYSRRDFPPTPEERIEGLIAHITLFDTLLGKTSNFATMKKHFKAYISGWDNAKDLRVRLMETSTAEEAIATLSAKDVLSTV